jgi:hypothetical protein
VTGRSSGIPLALGAAGLLVAAAALRRGSRNQPGRVRVEVLLDRARGGYVEPDDPILQVGWEGEDGKTHAVLIRGDELRRTGVLDGEPNSGRAHVAGLLDLFAAWVHSLRFPLALYRGLHLHADKDYNPNHPDVQYWSADERVALSFARSGLHRGQKMQVLMSEPISPDQVHWLSTLGLFLEYSVNGEHDEFEIAPKRDLKVVRVQEIVQRPDLLAARGSRSDAGRVRVYHGTADLGAASSILRQSKIRVRTEASRHYSAPLPGRAYVARELSEALMYTFGGFTWTTGGSGEIKTCGPNEKGALIVLEADEADCVPDEDWLGMIALRLICEPRRRGPPKQTPTWRGRPVEQETRLRVLDAVELCPSRSIQAWRRIPCWPDQAIESRTGKAMINHLLKTKKGRALLQTLAALSPNLACLPSGLRVVGAYEISKSALPQLRPDGSNLHEIGTPVSP